MQLIQIAFYFASPEIGFSDFRYDSVEQFFKVTQIELMMIYGQNDIAFPSRYHC